MLENLSAQYSIPEDYRIAYGKEVRGWRIAVGHGLAHVVTVFCVRHEEAVEQTALVNERS